MLAQLSDAGGARALAVHGCSLTCGQGPDELLGHIYLQMGERSMHAQMLALGAEVRAGGVCVWGPSATTPGSGSATLTGQDQAALSRPGDE